MRMVDTDRYKLTMAEAGFPLREETFYLTLRHGGPHLVGLDVAKYVRGLLDEMRKHQRVAQAHADSVKIQAVPPGSWVFDGEPVVKITGPSAMVSYLEPMLLQVHWRIQCATSVALGEPAVFQTVNREHDQALAELFPDRRIQTERISWEGQIRENFSDLLRVLGSPSRIFEVGLRAAVNAEHHLSVLQVLQEAGLTATSSCTSATVLRLASVGTMGHEHVMRHGSDYAAFGAMLGRVPGPVSLLVDTSDVYLSGIPAAIRVMREYPDRLVSLRFDSGNLLSQFAYAEGKMRELGLSPSYIFEDGLRVGTTILIERMREALGISPDRVSYGYGGFLVNPEGLVFTRDRVSAVYKLCCTGLTGVWKKTPGKVSLAGNFDVWTPYSLTSASPPSFTGFVTQPGELGPRDCVSIFNPESPRRFLSAREAVEVAARQNLRLSEETRQIP